MQEYVHSGPRSPSDPRRLPPATGSAPSDLAGLPWPIILNYAVPAAPLTYMTMLAGMYLLKFASDVLLLAPALFSGFFAVSKLVDAISDPAAGYASDRTRGLFGRRRPWLLVSAIPICACFWAVWCPPSSVGSDWLPLWACAALLLYYLAHTAAAVPHLALGAELSTDHHDRTRIFGTRAAFEFVGIAAAAGSMVWLQTTDDPRASAHQLAALFTLATLAALIPTTFRMRERPEFQARLTSPPLRALQDVASNPHARILLGVLVLDTLSFSLMGVLFPFIAAYALPEGSAPSSTTVALAIAIAIASFPLWPALARRYGKREAWRFALVLRIAGLAAVFFAFDSFWMQPVALLLVGGSFSCTYILPPSIKADVIDYDELQSGDRKEGSYFACWNLAQKLASAGAVAISGVALQLVGFEANAEQSRTAVVAMQWLFAGGPLLLHLVALWLLSRLRMDAAEHARIRDELDRRSPAKAAG